MPADPIKLLEDVMAALDAMETDETDNDDSTCRVFEIYDRIDDLPLDGPTAAYTKLYAFLVQANVTVGEESGLDFAGAIKALKMLLPQRKGTGEKLAPLAA